MATTSHDRARTPYTTVAFPNIFFMRILVFLVYLTQNTMVGGACVSTLMANPCPTSSGVAVLRGLLPRAPARGGLAQENKYLTHFSTQ